jgi:hypothetical protein
MHGPAFQRDAASRAASVRQHRVSERVFHRFRGETEAGAQPQHVAVAQKDHALVDGAQPGG